MFLEYQYKNDKKLNYECSEVYLKENNLYYREFLKKELNEVPLSKLKYVKIRNEFLYSTKEKEFKINATTEELKTALNVIDKMHNEYERILKDYWTTGKLKEEAKVNFEHCDNVGCLIWGLINKRKDCLNNA